MAGRDPWIRSAAWDLAFITGPALVAVAAVAALPALQAPALPAWGWLLFVVGVDVAHVWSSLWRTYLDPDEFARRRTHYVLTPILCFTAGFVLWQLGGAALFWRVLAYLAVLHFVRQQFGFVMVYRHRAGERDHAWIDKTAIYATMLYPLAFWHASDDRVFVWFVAGDFLAVPAVVKAPALALYSAALGLFAGRQLWLLRHGRPLNWPKIGVVVSTALVWYVGIVALNSDLAFTVTNTVAHGVPYMALVWLYGRRKWEGSGTALERVHRPAWAFAFVGVVLAFAYLEEALWDVLHWHQHAQFFGGLAVTVPDLLAGALVPFLILPQATHYVLDAWIWKFDGSNPGLRYYLFLDGARPS
jgi:hypothetical protein